MLLLSRSLVQCSNRRAWEFLSSCHHNPWQGCGMNIPPVLSLSPHPYFLFPVNLIFLLGSCPLQATRGKVHFLIRLLFLSPFSHFQSASMREGLHTPGKLYFCLFVSGLGDLITAPQDRPHLFITASGFLLVVSLNRNPVLKSRKTLYTPCEILIKQLFLPSTLLDSHCPA